MNNGWAPTKQPIPDYGEDMALGGFLACVRNGLFTNDDGDAYLATAKHMLNERVSPSHLDDRFVRDLHARGVTHIVWMNK